MARNPRPVEAHLDATSRRLRAALAEKGFQVSEAEADTLACVGFAVLVELEGPAVVGEAEAKALSEKFVAAAKHCAARAEVGR